jgi:hypothetical protein
MNTEKVKLNKKPEIGSPVSTNQPDSVNESYESIPPTNLKVPTTEPSYVKGSTFPTNAVPLPSKGLLYPLDSPLRQGYVEMKFMTAKEENILTTESYINQGIVIDKFLESMVVAPKFNFNELLSGDKDALIVASRIYGHGEIYNIEVTAPSGKKQKLDIDLTTLEHKEFPEDLYVNGENKFKYSFENRFGRYDLTFKLLTGEDNRNIESALKKYKKAGTADKQVTTRLEHMILSVNGNSDPTFIKLFVENEFLSRDYRTFRDYVASITPGVNFEIEVVDEETGDSFRSNVALGPDFFWPDIRI